MLTTPFTELLGVQVPLSPDGRGHHPELVAAVADAVGMVPAPDAPRQGRRAAGTWPADRRGVRSDLPAALRGRPATCRGRRVRSPAGRLLLRRPRPGAGRAGPRGRSARLLAGWVGGRGQGGRRRRPATSSACRAWRAAAASGAGSPCCRCWPRSWTRSRSRWSAPAGSPPAGSRLPGRRRARPRSAPGCWPPRGRCPPEVCRGPAGGGAEDAVLTDAFSVMWPRGPEPHRTSARPSRRPRRSVKRWSGAHGRHHLAVPRFGVTPTATPPARSPPLAHYAGQGVGATRQVVPAAQVVEELAEGAERSSAAGARRPPGGSGVAQRWPGCVWAHARTRHGGWGCWGPHAHPRPRWPGLLGAHGRSWHGGRPNPPRRNLTLGFEAPTGRVAQRRGWATRLSHPLGAGRPGLQAPVASRFCQAPVCPGHARWCGGRPQPGRRARLGLGAVRVVWHHRDAPFDLS